MRRIRSLFTPSPVAGTAWAGDNLQKDFIFSLKLLDVLRSKVLLKPGSRALTTALALEAWGLHEKQKRNESKRAESNDPFHLVRTAAGSFSPACETFATEYADSYMKDPFWRMLVRLSEEVHRVAPYPNLGSLKAASEAHRSGLIGYAILDSIVDGQCAARFAGFATYLARRCQSAYMQAAPQSIFVACVLERMERAMTQEEYKTVEPEDKSMGVALPALLACAERGTVQEVNACEAFFSGLLAARQWQDDAHDLREDLQCGRITQAGRLALDSVKLEKKREFPADLDGVCHVFWRTGFNRASEIIARHLQRARRSLAQTPFAGDPYFLELIVYQERQLAHARSEHGRALEFLASYAPAISASR